MQKNVASQSVMLFAFDIASGAPKTGDAANMVFYVTKDFGTVTAITASSGVPTEVDSTNAKGWYKIALAQAETNADNLQFTGKSTTANVSVVGRPIDTFPANFSSESIDSSGRIDVGKINGVSTSSVTTVKAVQGLTTADTIATYTGNTPQTGDAYTRIGAAGVGLTNLGDTRIANLDATVSSRMATYTQPSGFLAATFPSGTIANTTNITAGTITTATNVTNAPTAGDFTATMKTSLNAATPASVQNISAQTGDSFARLGVPVSASISADIAGVQSDTTNIKTRIPAALVSGRMDSNVSAMAIGVINASALASDAVNAIADGLLDRADAIEAGMTPRQSLRLNTAASAGKLSGAATTTVVIRNAVADSKNRITATVDSNGNRTAITTDLS